MSVKSRNGHVFTVSGCPFHWASKLQTLAALSSTESEIICLSESMHHLLLPLREIVDKIREHMGPEKECQVRMKSKVFEDNNGCIAAATSSKITPRSKHIGTACFFFGERTQDATSLSTMVMMLVFCIVLFAFATPGPGHPHEDTVNRHQGNE